MKIKKILSSLILTLLTLVLVFLVVARAELKEKSLQAYEAVPVMETDSTPSPSCLQPFSYAGAHSQSHAGAPA